MKTTDTHNTGDRVKFKDGQVCTVKAVFTSAKGPLYLVESEARAVFTCYHSEVRRAR